MAENDYTLLICNKNGFLLNNYVLNWTIIHAGYLLGPQYDLFVRNMCRVAYQRALKDW